MKKTSRRSFLTVFGLGAGLGSGMASGLFSTDKLRNLLVKDAHAYHTDTHFEDTVSHKLVYQCNKADHDYIDHILFSCGEMLRKYGDDIELVIATYGPGVNLLVENPKRSIDPRHQKQVKSLMAYGVRFLACGNTMKTMKWSNDDLLEDVGVSEIGVDGIMKMQEQGFSYIAM